MKRFLNKLIRAFRKPLILQLKYKVTTDKLNKLQETLDKELNRKVFDSAASIADDKL
ncbi:hypothetical protein P5F14_02245 [Clostridium perfringens]|uniref:hypothetical protein n=1 Tax=Clostridium perfringens TaxID=1502 RepID=UPI002A28A8B7|nr:hypothetical protein [Clostridium perfringens]MDK0754245.1 hypothetical protein [Clostridium perfringens]MDK0757419.1 hypothetical protein [Clostridium perfringens]MDK0941419.1 hypothetical protein [Clostridium perfringens]